jgi:hypothetical protein
MQAFRSEAEIDRWCADAGIGRGAVFTPEVLWKLASVWYDDRLQLDWRRRTPAERQALLERASLTGDFWRLERPTP